jgi:hypothetical protein
MLESDPCNCRGGVPIVNERGNDAGQKQETQPEQPHPNRKTRTAYVHFSGIIGKCSKHRRADGIGSAAMHPYQASSSVTSISRRWSSWCAARQQFVTMKPAAGMLGHWASVDCRATNPADCLYQIVILRGLGPSSGFWGRARRRSQ